MSCYLFIAGWISQVKLGSEVLTVQRRVNRSGEDKQELLSVHRRLNRSGEDKQGFVNYSAQA